MSENQLLDYLDLILPYEVDQDDNAELALQDFNNLINQYD